MVPIISNWLREHLILLFTSSTLWPVVTVPHLYFLHFFLSGYATGLMSSVVAVISFVRDARSLVDSKKSPPHCRTELCMLFSSQANYNSTRVRWIILSTDRASLIIVYLRVRATLCVSIVRFIHTRKLSYRKDDRAMRALCMSALKIFRSPWQRPRLLLPNF